MVVVIGWGWGRARCVCALRVRVACVRRACVARASGIIAKCIEPRRSSSGSAALRFWYWLSVKNGVRGAIMPTIIIKTS